MKSESHGIVIAATHLGLRDIGPWLRALLSSLEPSQRDQVLGAIELAVHELANNAVDHAEPASGEISLIGGVEGDELVVILRDDGQPFVTPAPLPPDEPQIRGYGLMIVEQIATAVDYQRQDGENTWSARFSLSSHV